jgi:cold shock CspA family protein
VQFTGIVKSYDADEGIGYIVREPDRHEILVRSSGLALGVDALYKDDRVAFDIDMGDQRAGAQRDAHLSGTRVSPGKARRQGSSRRARAGCSVSRRAKRQPDVSSPPS